MKMMNAEQLRALEAAEPLDGPIPPVTALPYGYRWDETGQRAGLWYDPPSDGDNPKPSMHLAGLFSIVAQTRDVDGHCWGLLLRWADNNNRQHEWAMPKAMLAARMAGVWETLMDRGLFVAAGPAARNKLADCLNLVRPNVQAIAAERTGWHDDLFVMPGRTYGPEPSQMAVYQGAPLPKGFTASRGTLEGWQGEIAAKAVGNSRLMMCIAAAFVGPILNLAGAEGGGLHLRGDTSGGKTTCLKAAASVWGDSGAWVQTWRMTANAVESTAAQHSETLLCLDELRELAARDAVTVPYMLAHGRAKGRQRAEGGLRRQLQWRVFFLSTGELSLADLAAQAGDKPSGGTDVRMVDISADAGAGRGVWEALHGHPSAAPFADALNDAVSQNYGSAAPVFLEKLANDRDGARSAIRETMRRWEAHYVPACGGAMVRRAGKHFALVAAAGELARSFGVLPWGQGGAERAMAQLFEQWCAARGSLGAPEDERAMEALRAFIHTHGESRFDFMTEGGDGAPDRPAHNRAGWRRLAWAEGGHVSEWLITPQAWREIAREAGLPGERVAKAARAAGWLHIGADGKSSQSIRVRGGARTRLYVIRQVDDDPGLG